MAHQNADTGYVSSSVRDLMFSGGFHQVFITDTNPQLTIPIASAKETSGLINSKETIMKLLTCGNEKEQALKSGISPSIKLILPTKV